MHFYLFTSTAPTHLTQLAASCLYSIKVGLNHTLERSPFGGQTESRWSHVANCMLVAQQQIRAAQYIFTFPGTQCCAYAMYARCCNTSVELGRHSPPVHTLVRR